MARVKKVKGKKLHRVIKKNDNVIKTKDKMVKNDDVRKKVKPRKIHMSLSVNEENNLDNEIAKEDNFSVGLMVCILAFCFVIGIVLGYLLYKIAIHGVI